MSDSLRPHGVQYARLPCPSSAPKTKVINTQNLITPLLFYYVLPLLKLLR